MFQEWEPRSEWHQERELASDNFRRVVEDQPRDVRKVIASFHKIDKVLFVSNMHFRSTDFHILKPLLSGCSHTCIFFCGDGQYVFLRPALCF